MTTNECYNECYNDCDDGSDEPATSACVGVGLVLVLHDINDDHLKR